MAFFVIGTGVGGAIIRNRKVCQELIAMVVNLV